MQAFFVQKGKGKTFRHAAYILPKGRHALNIRKKQPEPEEKSMLMCLIGLLIVIISLAQGKNAARIR